MLVKTPTSSLTVGELLVNRLWYRTKAKIVWLFYGTVPEVSTARPSPIAKLPRELVEMVISCFTYDKRSLLACSMTCYSWYMIAVSYLHHSLTTDDELPWRGLTTRYFNWPRPLKKPYELGLLPFVKRFRIRLDRSSRRYTGFTSDRLGRRTLRYLSALTNLQELGIDFLQIPSFMPNIQLCFGHFSPTLRFLALRNPCGSCRQVLYFIGLFPNLQDLKLCYDSSRDERESAADATLVPLSIPPLRGWLTLTFFTRENLVKDMIYLFGGLRFHCMDLFRVKCVRLLLDACTDTLETLRLYPTDPYENNSDLLHHFNLSRNKCLRTLETTAEAIDFAQNAASDFFKTVLPSSTLSVPLDIVIIYRDFDLGGNAFCFCGSQVCFRHHPRRFKERDAWCHQQQLRVFREMYKARDFRLVLCADVSDCTVEHGKGVLEHIAKAGQFLHEPLVIAERRTLHTRYTDPHVGWASKAYTFASAL